MIWPSLLQLLSEECIRTMKSTILLTSQVVSLQILNILRVFKTDNCKQNKYCLKAYDAYKICNSTLFDTGI